MVVPLSTTISYNLTWGAGEWCSAKIVVGFDNHIFEHSLNNELAGHFGVSRVLNVGDDDHHSLNGDSVHFERESAIGYSAWNFD